MRLSIYLLLDFICGDSSSCHGDHEMKFLKWTEHNAMIKCHCIRRHVRCTPFKFHWINCDDSNCFSAMNQITCDSKCLRKLKLVDTGPDFYLVCYLTTFWSTKQATKKKRNEISSRADENIRCSRFMNRHYERSNFVANVKHPSVAHGDQRITFIKSKNHTHLYALPIINW